MRAFLFFIFSLFITLETHGQSNMRLTIEWNQVLNRYEVFLISSGVSGIYNLADSKISVVLPKDAPDQSIKIENHAGGKWIVKEQVFAPASATENDFQQITSEGGQLTLKSNEGMLLFSFKFVDDTCREGVRLFNNGADPAKDASGFNGIDFSNSIFGSNGKQLYHSNVLNSGTKCMDCPVDFSLPKLIKKKSR